MYSYDFIEDVDVRWLQQSNTTAGTFAPSIAPSTTFAPSVTPGCLNVTTQSTGASDVSAIRNSLRTFGSIYLICFLIFCCVRTRYPRIYRVRSWAPNLRIDLAKIGYHSIDWFWKLWWIPDDDFREQCGMDALSFIRMLRFGLQIACVGMFNSIWLLPVYGTAKFSPETEQVTDHLEMVTVAHLPPGSNRFFATVIAAYITFGSIMYFLLREFEWFTENRHKFLASKKASNYTVYVSHIPLEYRSDHKLLDYFRSCYSHDSVLEAHVALDIPDLESKVASRDAVLAKLEHALNIEEVTGTAPTHIDLLQGGQKVDTIQALSDELKELNTEVKERVVAIQNMHDPQSFKKDVESQGGTVKPMSSNFGGDEVSELQMDDPLLKQPKSEEEAEQTGVGALFSSVKSGAGGLAHMAVDLIDGEDDGVAREAGFVTFTKLSATQSALQMIHHPTPFSMDVTPAPEPDDIYWNNVGKSHESLQIGFLISLALTTLLCVFWTIPVSFVVSLTEVESLKKVMPFLEPILNDNPWIGEMLKQAGPIILILLNALLPMILGAFCALEGPVSSSVLGASLFVKLAAFMVIQTFFVSAIAGSLTKSIQCLIDDPLKGIDFLASALPGQATFYVQLLLIRTCIGQGLELLRVVPIIIAFIRSKVGPNLTDKERNSTWMGLRPFADPTDFQYPEVASNCILYFMVLFVYSTLAPTTNWFMGFCFVLLISGYRHQLVYIYPSTPDSGGQLFIGFINLCLPLTLVAQVTLFGVFALKRAATAGPLMFPLIITSILFNFYIRQKHFFVTTRLPSKNCLKQDLKNMENEVSYDFVSQKYVQPALLNKEDVFPENMSVARVIAQQNIKFLTPPSSEVEQVPASEKLEITEEGDRLAQA